MYSYRITKYHEYNEEGYLTSPPEEWLDYSDIKKGIVSLEDYLIVEQEFIRIIFLVIDFLKIKKLYVSDLEVRTESPLSTLVVDDEIIKKNHLADVATMLLRREIWCKLISDNLQFHFGYDYYMYCVSNCKLDELFDASNTFLNIEKFKSPYLN